MSETSKGSEINEFRQQTRIFALGLVWEIFPAKTFHRKINECPCPGRLVEADGVVDKQIRGQKVEFRQHYLQAPDFLIFGQIPLRAVTNPIRICYSLTALSRMASKCRTATSPCLICRVSGLKAMPICMSRCGNFRPDALSHAAGQSRQRGALVCLRFTLLKRGQQCGVQRYASSTMHRSRRRLPPIPDCVPNHQRQ